MAKRRTKNPIEQEYFKNRRRIQRQLSRMENRGYLISPDLLPAIPKKITPASVRRLEKIKPDTLYQRAEYVDTETGEILKGKVGRKVEKEKVSKSRYEKSRKRRNLPPIDFTTIVLRNFQIEMTDIFGGRNNRLLNYVMRWYEKALATYGPDDLAKGLEQSKENGAWPGWEAVSDEERLVGSLATILDIIGGSEGYRQEIIDAMEEMEDFDVE